MKKTLQDQYLLIKEGKGHKGVFLTEAKRQFPDIVRNAATFEEAVSSLKTKSIISENVIGLNTVAGYEPRKKESYETAFEAFLAEAKKKENEDEKVKAEEKKVSKKVEEDLAHNFDNTDEKNPDNMIFGQIMMGYYAEMKDPKNSEKTMEELKDIVFKNLAKDPIYYTKNAQFGVKDLGYTDEAPALGMPKEAKGKYKSSGYGDLNEVLGSYGDNPHQSTPLDIEDYLEQIEGMSKSEAIEYLGRQGLSSSQALKVISQLNTDVRDMFDQDPDVRITTSDDLYEQKLRKVIREMIEGELEEITSSSFKAVSKPEYVKQKEKEKADKEEREPQDQYPSLNPTISRSLLKNENIQIIGNKVFIEDRLREPVNFKRLSIGTDPAFMTFLNDASNIAGLTKMANGKGEKVTYALLTNVRVSEKTGNIQYLKKAKPKKAMEGLMESVEKDLAAINKEAEHEVLQSKMEKIQSLIDKKQSQLSKLDEDEDMKNLTDDKKVKEISKDIKALEKAKAKLEKLMGKVKGKKKEVIDEMDADEYDINPEYKKDAVQRQDAGQSIDSITNTYTNIPSSEDDDLEDYLEDRVDNY